MRDAADTAGRTGDQDRPVLGQLAVLFHAVNGKCGRETGRADLHAFGRRHALGHRHEASHS